MCKTSSDTPKQSKRGIFEMFKNQGYWTWKHFSFNDTAHRNCKFLYRKYLSNEIIH